MKLVNIEPNSNIYIKKTGEFIRHASYKLSAQSMKILLIFLTQVRTEDNDFEEYTLQVSKLKKLIKSNSNSTYKYAKDAIQEIKESTLEIDGKILSWSDYAIYNEGDATLSFKFSSQLKPYLLNLNPDDKGDFTKYSINNILSLKSPYQIRLYELCKDYFGKNRGRYLKKDEGLTFKLEVSRIRELLKTPDSTDVKKDILDKARVEFKKKTDIQISYTPHRIGRRIHMYKLTIKKN